MIANEALRRYAELLSSSGFTVYVLKSRPASHIVYSQVSGGRECFGMVQQWDRGAFMHLMPIRPSRESGSSMFVDGVLDELTVEAAQAVAQPTNWNSVVGTRDNYKDPELLDRMYARW